MSQDLETVKKLYEQSKAFASTPAPKQGFTGTKCPKCGTKIKKESIKQPLFSGEGGTEFALAVANDFKAKPGLYSFSIDSYKCSCGYEYIGSKLDWVEL
jgi:hypothetical protein